MSESGSCSAGALGQICQYCALGADMLSASLVVQHEEGGSSRMYGVQHAEDSQYLCILPSWKAAQWAV